MIFMDKKIINFKTEAEMLYKSSNIDPNHWANKKQTHLLKNKIYNKIEQKVVYCPAFLNGKKYNCSNCNNNFEPNWLLKRRPILPYVTTDGRFLKMMHAEEKCSVCNNNIYIDIPYVQHVCERKLYGDEAFRIIEGKIILSYSFIGEPIDRKVKDKMYRQFLELKSKLVKSISPTSWTLHFTELWSTEKRNKNKYMKGVTFQEIIHFANELAGLLREYSKEIDIFNATAVFEQPRVYKKKEEQELKARAYYAVIYNCLYNHTKNGFSPHFFFERTGSDGWAKNLFQGGMLTLAWPFLTHSNPIRDPEFVPPTHDFFLELADFVSFIIARYLFQVGAKSAGNKVGVVLNPNILGMVHYTGFRKDGGGVNYSHENYPLKEFFSGTDWAEIKLEQHNNGK